MERFNDTPIRIVVAVRATDLPGEPGKRHNTLAELISANILKRPFRPWPQVKSFDYSHTVPDLDTNQPKRKWFICDFNVKNELSRTEVRLLPHKVYSMSLQDNEWYEYCR
jgi:hypothetical protein